jgi:arginyl-tRNA synthetase
MDPYELRNEISRLIAGALAGMAPGHGLPDARVTPSRNPGFGDLSSQVAMQMAGLLGRPPIEIAEEIASRIAPALPAGTEVATAPPGFLNFTLSAGHLTDMVYRLASGGLAPLLPDAGCGRRAQVEFVSSNPTGPLTVGHCRQAVLGEAVSRLLESLGWKVDREYYYNDTGRQMRLLGESLAARYTTLCGVPTDIPEGGYMGDYLAEWAGELREDRGDGLDGVADSELFESFARDRAMELIGADLDLLGIRFDRFFRESELIPDRVEEAIAVLRGTMSDQGPLVYERDGRLWLRFTSLDRPEDRVIVRENGLYTYRMPDIAYHLDKLRRGYDLIVDVFGADHLDTSRDVSAALAAIAGPEEVARRLRIVIHQFVTLVRGGEKVRMSTRAADYVTLRDLVEEVGSADVTRYLFLTRRAEAHMDFDLDLARRQSDDNPVFYVQYAHARISGIMRHAAEAGIGLPGTPEGVGELLDGERERDLMRLLESLPERIVQAGEALEPHRLTEILAETATAFHGFYQHDRVVDLENPALSSARLLLCEACRRALGGVLGILGVEAPESM